MVPRLSLAPRDLSYSSLVPAPQRIVGEVTGVSSICTVCKGSLLACATSSSKGLRVGPIFCTWFLDHPDLSFPGPFAWWLTAMMFLKHCSCLCFGTLGVVPHAAFDPVERNRIRYRASLAGCWRTLVLSKLQ